MVSAPEPALYVGEVRHRRLKPKVHAFTYPLFMAFLDIDRIPELCKVSPFLSYGGWNWAAFHEEDQFGDPTLPLRERLRLDAETKGHALPDGPIYLLTHLRYLGICFNPVSYFYCHDREGRLALIMAQVTNTPWRERHTYWMPVAEGHQREGGVSFEVPKAFHVSPFMPMDCHYRWAFTPPGETLRVHIAEFNCRDLFFDASLHLQRQPWTAGILRKTLIRFPWMTLKVLAAIHWEALWLWIKRVPVFTHPGPSTPPTQPPASPSASS
ncbi:DUF1365 domain-containing protein [Geothrix sp. PMB-07]|uniref:DUF1365 domain-containing protein n=1 Tax=Geothrix sp. PMB-07 TaxID=3068640 RepID=UPI00274194B9|nr:DUF1365 domain-containing protein [Geothrix sp. PMB-07]WLT30627.1 DUF1365 domain-containing protein [Geothrix sp. PMB-07]